MSVESAADLASFFNTDEFGEWVVYTPPGGVASDPVSVIIDRGQARQQFEADRAKATSAQRKIQAQINDLATINRDGVFVVTDQDGVALGEYFKVVGKPELDETGRWWIANIVIDQAP